MKRLFMTLIACILLSGLSLAQTSQPLFHIERTMNANKLYYQAQIGPDGKIDSEEPVKAHWVMWAKDPSGKTTEGMNFIERTKVYGFNIKADSGKSIFNMTLKPFKERLIKVYMLRDTARAEMVINGRPSFFTRMFIFSKGNSKPDSIKLYGIDVETEDNTYELFIPKN
jgi:hypothetical protein